MSLIPITDYFALVVKDVAPDFHPVPPDIAKIWTSYRLIKIERGIVKEKLRLSSKKCIYPNTTTFWS